MVHQWIVAHHHTICKIRQVLCGINLSLLDDADAGATEHYY